MFEFFCILRDGSDCDIYSFYHRHWAIATFAVWKLWLSEPAGKFKRHLDFLQLIQSVIVQYKFQINVIVIYLKNIFSLDILEKVRLLLTSHRKVNVNNAPWTQWQNSQWDVAHPPRACWTYFSTWDSYQVYTILLSFQTS